ncbi:MAG: aromatic ring-hydroxylating dioxygenase subunit alpha [Alphaproteobacteria bacterium]|nr:aromatic ring-hydroxylating dioxygenase subunit alpha [Alphaproteobacteria bacterium]
MGLQQNIAPISYDALVQRDRVHGRLYTDPNIFSEEMDRIYHKGWVFAGHTSEVPDIGDYQRRQIGQQPVLITRDAKNDVKLLFNRCTHRGNMICARDSGNAATFVCPYHGWTFAVGGELRGMPMPGGMGSSYDKSALGLAEVPRVHIYRGFIFASLAHEGQSFDDYIGKAKQLLDRACDLSPEGEMELSAGWLKHRFHANWKMLPENNTDGYHVKVAHASLLRSTNAFGSLAFDEEKGDSSVNRDWGGGHTELDIAPRYRNTNKPFQWFGGVPEAKLPNYVARMEQTYGRELARKRMIDGPPHAIIFPNLFLAELNISFVAPVSANQVVQYYTPMLLKGAPEINARALRQTEGAMGPGSFLLPDDACLSERNQLGLAAQSPEWLDLRRGMEREYVDPENGLLSSNVSDETTNRAFWKQYLHVMSGAA